MKLSKTELALLSSAFLMSIALVVYNAVSAPPFSSFHMSSSDSSNIVLQESKSVDSVMEAALPAALYSQENSSAAEQASENSLPVGTDNAEPKNPVSSITTSSFSASGAPEKPSAVTVNLNTASEQSLADVLPGVGEVIAQRIVEYRELNNGFKSVDELINVKGIGPVTLEKMRPYAKVTD